MTRFSCVMHANFVVFAKTLIKFNMEIRKTPEEN